MSARDRLVLEHERTKRRLDQDLEGFIRDQLGAEGMSNFMISAVVGAGMAAIALAATGVGAIVAVVIIAIAGILLAFGIDANSTSLIKAKTAQFGRNEDSEDESYLRALESLED